MKSIRFTADEIEWLLAGLRAAEAEIVKKHVGGRSSLAKAMIGVDRALALGPHLRPIIHKLEEALKE